VVKQVIMAIIICIETRVRIPVLLDGFKQL